LKRKIKFWLLLLLGTLIFMPFILISVLTQLFIYAASFLGGFLIYCYMLYRHVYKGEKPRYPLVPPEGRTDIYFPRTDIPRPIYEDLRRYPQFFKHKRRKKKTKKSKS